MNFAEAIRGDGQVHWVSCNRDDNERVSLRRHILPSNGDTTLCGATGMPASVWRGNSTKAKCPVCERLAA